MSSETAILVENISKCYQIYDQPHDRLKQFLLPRVQRATGLVPKKYFREFWALRDVSFEVKRGETVGIVGRNGSGKSTLLQIICGTLAHSAGQVETNGRIAALLELGSGFNPEFTGRENVYLNASVLGLSNEEISQRFDDIASFADIGQFLDQPVKTYSSGMVVRLAFAVAINVRPQILVVDEALSVGDELFQRKCFSRIESIKESGATILFVSHSGSTVVDLCDRAVLLDAGELIGVGQPKSIVARYQKLLYAPEHKREAVRDEIIRTSLRASDAGPVEKIVSELTDLHGVTSDDDAEEPYDPNLRPMSTVSYESHGVRIVNPRIMNLADKQVNVLRRGRNYRYCYEVEFDQSAANVRFGMLIKTTSGTELGGAASAPQMQDSIVFVKAGSKARVEFSFKCALNGGVYFLNAGVVGSVTGMETYLHRVIDFAMFRVLPDPSATSTGVVDFGVVPDFEIR